MVWEEYLTILAFGEANGVKLQGMKDKLENPLLFGQDLYLRTKDCSST